MRRPLSGFARPWVGASGARTRRCYPWGGTDGCRIASNFGAADPAAASGGLRIAGLMGDDVAAEAGAVDWAGSVEGALLWTGIDGRRGSVRIGRPGASGRVCGAMGHVRRCASTDASTSRRIS